MVNEVDSISLARLSEEHQPILANFNCFNDNEFAFLPSKKRRRIRDLSLEMNSFLQEEALNEQNSGLNNTFLLFKDGHLAGFVSLCADSLKLSEKEKESEGVSYETIPALKVARLAVDYRFHRNGLGKKLLDFSVANALHLANNFCGVRFLTLDCYAHRLSYYKQYGFIENEIHNDGRPPHLPISLRLNIFDYLDKL
jgi:predicted GNAT family N-acyltransferase